MAKAVAGREARREFQLNLPGIISRTGWQLPKKLSFEDWEKCGIALGKIEGAVQWWLGDWWVYGEQRKWGDGEKLAEQIGIDYGTIRNYGAVARNFELSSRDDKLSFTHHRYAMAAELAERAEWLRQANEYEWSGNELKAAIARKAAIDRTTKIELEATKVGKFVVLYADPPWRYENPPMGGSNRSIENHYPTMELEEICALPVGEIAHENSILFMWATSPKLAECFEVLRAWGFNYRTDMVWVKDKIGMGYHVREQHESLLIAKRGELAPPPVEARPPSVVSEPRLEHSAKPLVFYDLIDRMYPDVRKIELFGRAPVTRELWTVWGNQALAA